MSPDNKHFSDLRRKAEQRAAELERLRRGEQARNQQRFDTQAAQEAAIRAKEDRLEQARRALEDSDFPQLVEELIGLHQQAGLSHIETQSFVPSRHSNTYGRNLADRLKGEYHMDIWKMEFPFQQSDDTALIFVSWGDYFGPQPHEGLAIEAFPDRKIIVVGRGQTTLSEGEWSGNLERQYGTLKTAYDKPMTEIAGPRKRDQFFVHTNKWEGGEKGGGARS